MQNEKAFLNYSNFFDEKQKLINKKALMKLKNITIESINKDFSSLGGIKIYDLIYKSLNIGGHTIDLLPAKKKNSKISQEKKFKSLIFKFICGGDCLDDLDWLRLDTVINAITNGAIAATTAGEFLRSFKTINIEELEDKLADIALT